MFDKYAFCDSGYYGSDCQFESCNSTQCQYSIIDRLEQCTHCSNHGDCEQSSCLCESGFTGEMCENSYCIANCSSHGICKPQITYISTIVTASMTSNSSANTAVTAQLNYVCQCSSGWTGDDCLISQCSSDQCNFPRGACNYTSGTCDCLSTPIGLYTGPTCERFITSNATGIGSQFFNIVIPLIGIFLQIMILSASEVTLSKCEFI